MMINLEKEIEGGITRYNHLILVLNEMTEVTMEQFAAKHQWFSIAAHVCRRFVNQSLSLATLFSCRITLTQTIEYGNSDDLSSIYSLIRMQFELHALFYHLFIPCIDIEENVLRFRLWELENTKYRIKNNPLETPEILVQKKDDEEYEITILESIDKLNYFQNLPRAQRDWLVKKCHWRFTSESLSSVTWKNPVSYKELIKNTRIDESTFNNLYAMLSNHTHPTLHGVYHHSTLSDLHIKQQKFVAISLVGIVTASIIEDFATRFGSARERLQAYGENTKEIITSLTKDSRTPTDI